MQDLKFIVIAEAISRKIRVSRIENFHRKKRARSQAKITRYRKRFEWNSLARSAVFTIFCSINSYAQGVLPFIVIARNDRFVTRFLKNGDKSLGTSLNCHEKNKTLSHLSHGLYHVLSLLFSHRATSTPFHGDVTILPFCPWIIPEQEPPRRNLISRRQLSTYSLAIIRMIPLFLSTNGSSEKARRSYGNATNIIEVETTWICRDEVELFRVLIPVLSKCPNRLIRNFPYGEPSARRTI